MNCRQVQKKLERFLDGEFESKQKKILEDHLSHCTDCMKLFRELKAIHVIGKEDFLPEPPKKYWHTLTRDISKRIPETGQKASLKKGSLWTKINKLLEPPKINYGLIGLATAAVIVFFVLQITLRREGGIPLTRDMTPPGRIETEHSMKDVSDEKISAQGEEEMVREDEPVQDQQKKGDRPVEVNAAGPRKKDEPDLNKPALSKEKTSTIPGSGEKSRPVISESLPASEVPSKPEAPEAKTDHLRGYREKSQKNEPDEERKLDQVQIASRESALEDADNEGSDFFRTQTEVMNQQSTADKIDLWESFVSKNTDSQFVSQAKWELAQLYYQRALETNSKKDIEQALNYYIINRTTLQSQQHYQTQQETLQNLKQNPAKTE